MYIHQNRHLVEDLSKIEHILPRKRPGRCGVEGGMHCDECMQRHLDPESSSSGWIS